MGVGDERAFGLGVYCAFAESETHGGKHVPRALELDHLREVTVVVSLMTKPKPEEELVGLVYGATDIPSEGDLLWYPKADFLGGAGGDCAW